MILSKMNAMIRLNCVLKRPHIKFHRALNIIRPCALKLSRYGTHRKAGYSDKVCFLIESWQQQRLVSL